jgi:ADP-heptose:LPS heptosyltransferase
MVAPRFREILVVHPGALGDVLQAVPALAALRALQGDNRVTFAGQPRLGTLVAGVGLAAAAVGFDSLGLQSLFVTDPLPVEVRARLARFERVVSWFGSRAHPFPERLRSVAPGAVIAPPVPETGPPPTVWEHLLGTLAPWGLTGPAPRAPLGLPEAWSVEARATLSALGRDPGRPLLVVHPGAGGAEKLWPVEKFAQVVGRVVRQTGCQVLVHQGPADREATEELARALAHPTLALREPSLPLLAAVLQEASVYLGADSGVSHLAAAVGSRAVILFPEATRECWAPWSPTALPLTVNGGSNDVETVTRVLGERLATPEYTRPTLPVIPRDR